MKLSPRNALILTAVGLAVAVVALAFLLVFPQFGRLAELESQVGSADQEVSSAEALLQQRQQFKDGAAETDAELLQLAAAVPDTPDLPSLIIELTDVAYETNVQIVALTPIDPTVTGEYVTLPITMETVGSWADTVDFVQRLQRLTRQVRVTGVSDTPLGEGDAQAAVESLDLYAVSNIIAFETYLIPATSGGSSSASTVSAPPPATP